MKRVQIMSAVIALALPALMLTACGQSTFAVTENTEKRMVITAEKAGKDNFFMVGTLEAGEGEQIVVTSNLSKGKVRVEIIGVTGGQDIDTPPAPMSGEAILTADASGSESTSGAVPAGNYMLKATCLEKATGTIDIDVKPVS